MLLTFHVLHALLQLYFEKSFIEIWDLFDDWRFRASVFILIKVELITAQWIAVLKSDELFSKLWDDSLWWANKSKVVALTIEHGVVSAHSSEIVFLMRW